MKQNDLSGFISHISNKYEKPIFNINSEDHIISQAENLLLQFGVQSKNSPKKKKIKKTKVERNTKYDKKYFKPVQTQISTLIIAPNQNYPKANKEETENLFFQSDFGASDESSDIIDKIENNKSFCVQSNNKITDEKKEINPDKSKKRKILNEIDINSLKNLLDEIEADFSSFDKTKHENRIKYKASNANSNKNNAEINKIDGPNTNPIFNTKEVKKRKEKANTNRIKAKEDNDFSHQIDRVNYFFLKKYFKKMKAKYNLRNKYYEVIKFNRKILFKTFFNRWIEAKKDQQNLPRFKEFNHLKRIEELGDEYQKQIFSRKFLLIWARHYRLKIQNRQAKEIEIQYSYPHLKVKVKKPKVIKKPSPPPKIQVDPKIDEMIRQNKEIKDQKLNNVKMQIKEDKKKQQQIQKELIENEKKKRLSHLKDLQKQKIERQNKMKNEEEKIRNQRIFSLLCNKAENNYMLHLKKRVLKAWKSFLISNLELEDIAKYRLSFQKKKQFFTKLKENFFKKENNKISLAIQFNNRLLMKRTLIAIKKVKEERKKKIPIIQNITKFHLLHHFFNEWKFNEISSRRKRELKSIEFYEFHLLKRFFNAYLSSIKCNKEVEKRKNFKEKLIQKAHQFLNEKHQVDDDNLLSLTLNSENINSQMNQINNNSNDENDRDDIANNDNDYGPIQPLKDTLQISLNILDSNDELKFDNDSDDFF